MDRKNQIKAVIFDMGGVIVRTENKAARAALAARYAMTYDEIDAFVFNNPSAEAAALGEISEEQHWQNIGKRLNLTAQELQEFSRIFWEGDAVDRELVDFIGSLRPRYRTGLISNAWSGARKVMEEVYRALDVFDVTIFSAEVNLKKPEPDIFILALQRLGVEPEEAIFVDDFPANVEAACALGIHGIRFLTSAQVRTDILALLDT